MVFQPGDLNPLYFLRDGLHIFAHLVLIFLPALLFFFHAQKLNDINKLSRFLVIRGLLLVLLKETVIRFCWCFNFNYNEFFLVGVIWMLGWCMVLTALLVRLQAKIVWRHWNFDHYCSAGFQICTAVVATFNTGKSARQMFG
jgi:hypothetical protein